MLSKQRLVKVPWHNPSRTVQDSVNKAQEPDDSWWNMVVCFFIVFLMIKGHFGKFGYNERLEKSDYMNDDIDEDLRRLFYSIEFGLPFALIVVSYFGIWRKNIK